MFTPFGGRFQQRLLISLWAKLGIRNSFQKGMTAVETAARNHIYCQTGVNYPTRRQIEDSFSRHFQEVLFVEREFVFATREVSRASRLVAPLISLSGAEAVYRGFHTRVVLARK
jgi:hypothetical protein